ncbi:hypothetical protein B7494_g5541 [Chlorociboria aeruginascens]|nr:hypothetical protein B7494_g5541 [Chlorociboria aeruginascens]
MGCFSCRILVIGAVITHLYFQWRLKSSDDTTSQKWPQIVASQTIQSMNVVTACIPYLKPFYESLQSGMLGNDDLRRRQGSLHDTHLYSGGSGFSGKAGVFHSRSKQTSDKYGNTSIALSNLSTAPKRNSAESQSSQSNIIKKTQTFTVERNLQ